ncbi:MAG: PQQ-dependent sugar dehydrogenase [Gammaproteobacteria bacterium]
MLRHLLMLVVALGATASAMAVPDLSAVKLPPGFAIETWVSDVPNARSMTLGAEGTLFVGTRTAGKVYAVRNIGGDKRDVVEIASGLNMPNGVAFRDGDLYVAETHRIVRYDEVESKLAAPPNPVEVAQLPTERHHGWRYLAFGPDGKLYVPLGAPCNVCERFATIERMNADGSGRETVARGVRNSVGFTWHPRTGELWFTDNGRDLLGDDVPPDELNRLAKAGAHFGFPHCHGGSIVDTELGKPGACAQYVPPVQKLGPHVASLGVKFYSGTTFPKEYRGQLFIAEHGSWNRSAPIGYRITHVRLEGNRAVSYEPFATGWLGADGKPSGRPVDLLVLDDGSMLVSDDHAGAIYRVSWRG